ncbi:hypothetical protein M2352_000759 [Azospirillum fermentarium]|uniref:hypothetical protein n=1 Tax=Azospirillum fermentarium TaxID=1233114 RepID=UPI00222654E1|nr:hypothetical protein [Azospirillum fermentarium]MCW2245168.1 hypothetical protein [Azospirillum fermentarium]
MGRSFPRTAFAAALLASALSASPLLAQTAPAPAPVAATTVDETGAKTLAASIDTALKRFLPHTPQGGGARWIGAVTATPDGDAYKVTLPALSFAGDDGARMDVGIITFRLKPQTDGTQAFTAQLPASLPIFDAKGAADGTVTIGTQAISGVWVPAYETLTALDVSLGALAATNAKNQTLLKIGSMAGRMDLRPDGGGALYSGPGAFTIANLAVQDETGTPLATIGSFGTDFTYTRVDLEKSRKLTETARTYAETAGADPNPAPPSLTPADFRGLFGGMGFKVSLGDSTFFDPKDKTRVGLKAFALSMGIDGLDTPSTSVRFGYDHDGLAIVPPPGPADFMPGSAGFSIAALKLPTDALSQVLTIAAGKTDDTTGALVAGVLMGALGQAASEIRLEKLAVNTPATSGHAAGAATFAPGAALATTGAFTVTLTGLDNTIKALQPAPGKKPTKEDQDTLAGLTMVQALGQPGKDAQGKDARVYKIDITPQGQILLNGTDMSALLGLGADQGTDGGEDEEEEEAPAPAKRKL